MIRDIYIDSNFHVHASNPTGEYRPFEIVDFFDGKCDSYIEGYRFIPSGESWTRDDGFVFHGPMLTPWVDSRILEAHQEEYEANKAEMADMRAALALLGVTDDE